MKGASKGSLKGSLVNGCERLVDSGLEREVHYCLLANRNFVKVRDQWPRVPYKDSLGVDHTHTFDFWVKDVHGRRIAIAVKPRVFVNKARDDGPSVAEVMRLIHPLDLAPFADECVIYTDADVSKAAVYNALNLLRARKHRHAGDYQEALAYIEPICGTVLFHDLLRGAEFPAYRRIALWCLIDDGILVSVHPERINDRSAMRVNRHLINYARNAA